MRILVTIVLAVVTLTPSLLVAQETKSSQLNPAVALQYQIEDLVAAAQADRRNSLTTEVSRLILPNYRRWFAGTFGGGLSQPVADQYRHDVRNDVQGLKDFLSKAVKKGQTEVHVTSLNNSDDAQARGLQKRAFRAMVIHHTLYTVSLTRPGEKTGTKLWSFVYYQGDFRYLGKMSAMTEIPVSIDNDHHYHGKHYHSN